MSDNSPVKRVELLPQDEQILFEQSIQDRITRVAEARITQPIIWSLVTALWTVNGEKFVKNFRFMLSQNIKSSQKRLDDEKTEFKHREGYKHTIDNAEILIELLDLFLEHAEGREDGESS